MGFRLADPSFDADLTAIRQRWIDDGIRREVARIQEALNAGVEELVLPELAQVLTARGYTVLPPVKVGDTVTLTGEGWAQFTHPEHPSMHMLGLTATITEVHSLEKVPVRVSFRLGGERHIAPLRPGAVMGVTITTV